MHRTLARHVATQSLRPCGKETERNAAPKTDIYTVSPASTPRPRPRPTRLQLQLGSILVHLVSRKKPTRHTKSCCRRKCCCLPASSYSLHLFSFSPSVTPSTTSFCCYACEFVWLSPQWAAACEMQPNPQAAAIQIALPSAQRKSNCRLPSSLPFSSLSSPPSSLCVQCCLINACLRVWAAPLNTHNLLMKLNVFILWKLMEIFA